MNVLLKFKATVALIYIYREMGKVTIENKKKKN